MRSAVAIAMVLAAGCHQDVELDPGADGSTDARSSACAPIGSACAVSSECCSALCAAGTCRSSGTCAPIGESCSTGAQCCSRTCAPDGMGRVVCHPLGGCLTAGEVCRADVDCCGGASGGCVIVDTAAGLGRCAVQEGCAAAGEICRVTGDTAATRACCGDEAGRSLCRPAGGAELDRCATERAATVCVANGEPCATPEECCSGVCAPEGGVLVCSASCRAEGVGCTRAADCCGGECDDGTCRGATRSCLPLGAGCTAASGCCSGVCSGVCSAPPI